MMYVEMVPRLSWSELLAGRLSRGLLLPESLLPGMFFGPEFSSSWLSLCADMMVFRIDWLLLSWSSNVGRSGLSVRGAG
jgi:hypothetical protein